MIPYVGQIHAAGDGVRSARVLVRVTRVRREPVWPAVVPRWWDFVYGRPEPARDPTIAERRADHDRAWAWI